MPDGTGPGGLTTAEIEVWAQRLDRARLEQRPIPPLTDALHELSIESAYAIAGRSVAARVERGSRIIGHKIGLTAENVQRQLGVSEPDFGALLDDMQIANGAELPARAFIAPRVELELAFHLETSLTGPGVTIKDVQRATAFVQPAIEIVDSRITDWRIKLADTVADNASSAAFVLADQQFTLDEIDCRMVNATLHRNGTAVEQGRSDAVLGDPRNAVAWLGNSLVQLGTGLRAGDVVLSGACTRMIPASAGDAFLGDFGPLGRIDLSFS